MWFLIAWTSYAESSNQESREGLLYKKIEYGQDALFHPLNFYVNTAFDTIQNPYYFSQKRIYPNHAKVYDVIKDPIKGIERGGGGSKFFRDEFVGLRAFPNYALHFFGEGSDYRRLSEWFISEGVEAGYVYAFILSYAAQFGNEALESSNTRDIGPQDHIADLLFFDWVGKLAFLNDDFTIFVRDQMQMKTWTYQPLIDPSDRRVYNAGTNYIFRPKVFGDEARLRPILVAGMQVLAGVSYKFDSNDEVSFTQGMAYTNPLENKGKWATGIFYDRNGELLTSLFLNSTEDLRVRLNVYPGVVQFSKYPNLKLGLMSGFYRNNDWMMGAMINFPLGIGSVGRLSN